MQKTQVLGVVCAVLAVGALVANRAVGRIETDTMERLPVQEFPMEIGEWRCIQEIPTDPQVQEEVPTAVIVDRIYQDSKGRQINLTLLTATDYADFHDPNICFPGQGFALGPREKVEVAGQPCASMTAARDFDRLRMVYWWSGSAGVDSKYGREQMGKVLALRDKLVGHQGHSLFVRVLTEDGEESEATIEDFMQASRTALTELEAKAEAEEART